MSIRGEAGQVAEDWRVATEAALAAEMGDGAAAALLAAVLPVVPAGYDELNWPNSAAVDLPIVHRLAVAEPCEQVATAMMHFEEAAAHEWRFRVYHCGSPVPIASPVPILE